MSAFDEHRRPPRGLWASSAFAAVSVALCAGFWAGPGCRAAGQGDFDCLGGGDCEPSTNRCQRGCSTDAVDRGCDGRGSGALCNADCGGRVVASPDPADLSSCARGAELADGYAFSLGFDAVRARVVATAC